MLPRALSPANSGISPPPSYETPTQQAPCPVLPTFKEAMAQKTSRTPPRSKRSEPSLLKIALLRSTQAVIAPHQNNLWEHLGNMMQSYKESLRQLNQLTTFISETELQVSVTPQLQSTLDKLKESMAERRQCSMTLQREIEIIQHNLNATAHLRKRLDNKLIKQQKILKSMPPEYRFSPSYRDK